MSFEVLMSCMHQTDMQIIQHSNLVSVQTLVINQCDTEKDEMLSSDNHRMLNTSSRGLSVSRNLAIKNANADICLIADDDEIFSDNLEDIVLQGYELFPEADIIIYKLSNIHKKLGEKARKLKKYEVLRVASWQISFRTGSVRNKVAFDALLGAGSGNGCGEENKFLLDAFSAGLKIYYVPLVIGKMIVNSESTWFHGYDEKYFYDRGKTTRYMLGFILSNLYAIYTLVKKRTQYGGSISFFCAMKSYFKGIWDNELGKTNKSAR